MPVPQDANAVGSLAQALAERLVEHGGPPDLADFRMVMDGVDRWVAVPPEPWRVLEALGDARRRNSARLEGVMGGAQWRVGALPFAFAALIADHDLAPWRRYGLHVAELVSLIEAVWSALQGPGALPAPARDTLLRVLDDLDFRKLGVIEVLAERDASQERRERLRAWMSLPLVRKAWREEGARVADTARDIALGNELAVQFISSLERSLLELEVHATLRHVARPLRSLPLEEDLAEAMAGGLAALREHAPRWQESWDVQRWGTAETDEALVGQVFPRALILHALAQIGEPVQAEILALLEDLPEGPPRYFGAWAGIPPDSDDLGLLLQLAAALPEPPRPRVDAWLQVARSSASPAGRVPTWLRRGPDGEATAPETPWAGDLCSATALRFVAGAAAWDQVSSWDLTAATLEHALDQAQRDPVERGFFHYPPAQLGPMLLDVRRVAPRLLSKAQKLCWRALVQRAQEALVRGGDPAMDVLDRAAWIEVLAEERPRWGNHLPDLRAALRVLLDAQRPDGTWPEAPIFRTLLKKRRRTWHGGRLVSTALVLRGLHAAQVALEQAKEPRPHVRSRR
ncbi:MAG: hypothetical protein H6740_17760 [Alphaproteobacteria bacterium]|nr:hypothetical protein [Alphaproteobacteria bacterium]